MRNISGRIYINDKFRVITSRMAKYTFGAYLVHAFIIRVLFRLGLSALTFNPLAAIPVTVVSTFVISIGISAIINQVPILRKYIV